MSATRRQFLQSSLAASAAGDVLAAPAIRGQEKAKRYRTALVGTGWWGMNILGEAVASNACVVVGLCDVDENQLKAAPELDPAALAQLQAYPFPGNVRELENVLERAVTLSDGKRITADELRLRREPRTAELPAAHGTPLDQHVEELEKRAIRDALEKTKGNKTRAAALLGLTFRQLRYKAKKLGID